MRFSKFVIGLVLFGITSTANAQATRTWVSGVGDDVNPCSRTAPCKTFAGAISKTAVNGEISVLDPGGFGTVTITKSITIDGTGTIGSIISSGVNGIVINDSGANTAEVTLRNIDINGTTTGVHGIRFLSGKRLSLEGVRIANVSQNGVDVVTNGANVYLGLRDVVIENIGNLPLNVSPTAGSLIVDANNVRVFRSVNSACSFFNGNIRAVVSNSEFSGCPVGAGVTIAGGANVTLDHVRATGNANGVLNNAGSPTTTTRLTGCVLTGNSNNGALNLSGLMTAYQSNVIENPSGVTSTPPM
jgi:hypothetical protein